MAAARSLTPLDRLIVGLDHGLRTVLGPPGEARRPNPGEALPEADLDPEQQRLAAGLMRVNHAGEVSAQGLYQGQAFTARLAEVRSRMDQAADEETDHLVWCNERLEELGSAPSRLGPFWYAGSFLLGAVAGAVGDRWSLGFVVETERQVVAHIDGHLERLPTDDLRSRAILEQMREDEGHHATTALQAGGAPLPEPVKRLMTLASKVMTTLAYRV